MTLAAAAVVPPMVFPRSATTHAEVIARTRAVPDGPTPMKFPAMTFRVALELDARAAVIDDVQPLDRAAVRAAPSVRPSKPAAAVELDDRGPRVTRLAGPVDDRQWGPSIVGSGVAG